MNGSGARVAAVVGLIGSLLAACGSSGAKADGGGSSDSGGTVCADYAQKYCDRLQACAPGFLAIEGLASVAECIANYLPGCNDDLTAPHTGDTAALVQQCGDELASLSCTDLLQGSAVTSACLPRGGTIANGGTCSSDWQCASGRCFVSFTTTDQTIPSCGTCVSAIPLGEPCDLNGLFGSACADNLVCAVTTAGGTMPVCAKSGAIGSTCMDPAVCPANAYCDGTTHVCTQLPALGQTCDSSTIVICDPTKSGALCDATTSLCQPVTAAKAGDSCTPPAANTSVSCFGSCATPADASQDAGLGTCSPFVFEGQPCTDFDVCFIGTSCTEGVCTAPGCGGVASSGSDAATNAGPPAHSSFARRNLIRMPGAALAPTLLPRH